MYILHVLYLPRMRTTNPTHAKSSKLIYNFLIVVPFLVLHIDGYQVGKESGFEGSSHYLIACCGMCTFAVMELVKNANATMYASTIMNIILRFGFCYTCILNKDSNFLGVCQEALNLLQINCPVHCGLAGNVGDMSATFWGRVEMSPILGCHACWCQHKNHPNRRILHRKSPTNCRYCMTYRYCNLHLL